MSAKKKIDEILSNFDFEKCVKVMRYLDWRWAGEEVTVSMMKETATDILKIARKRSKKSGENMFVATGGLEASYYLEEKSFQLSFILEEWD